MSERVGFLTGHLAERRLHQVLDGLGDLGFEWSVLNIGVKVAALMTEALILRRLPQPLDVDRIILPGRAGVDPRRLADALGIPVERGPDELADLPRHLGRGGKPPDLSRYDIRIFGEIVDAVALSPDALLARARQMHADGADVIDIGCKPGTPFPGLETAISTLKAAGLRVSVDSGNAEELRRGALAGADFLLSLTEHTLDVVAGTATVPVLIPSAHGDLDSLVRAHDLARARGIAPILDPILDPIHFGFATSLTRYHALRERLPEAEILMGTGNLTELTDADTSGITAMLLGICSELAIRAVLIVQVSPHTRRTVAEHDAARRMMFAARANNDLPKNYGPGLLQVHDRSPFTQSAADIAQQADAVRDRNWRIATAPDGVHAWSAGRHLAGADTMAFFPDLAVHDDAAHAFYLGAELARAETAWTLGKRYVQDEPLAWGMAVPTTIRDRTRLAEEGHTLRERRRVRITPPPGDAEVLQADDPARSCGIAQPPEAATSGHDPSGEAEIRSSGDAEIRTDLEAS